MILRSILFISFHFLGIISFSMTFGIESLGVQLPQAVLDVDLLATLHKVDPEKFRIGLGCRQMALCGEKETVVDLAVGAAQKALKTWKGDPKKIGFLAVGTETSLDEARPLSAWVAQTLGLSGNIRSYEVKHACYGGMLAVRQALEWKLSGAGHPEQVALVVAADVCMYPFLHAAEPTQGAGAVALIIGDPLLCSLDQKSYCYSEPLFDFWRPTGQFYPIVQGKLSIDAYCRALYQCAKNFTEEKGLEDFLALDHLCFHVPFPKMVFRAVSLLVHRLKLTEQQTEKILKDAAQAVFWNQDIGNAYTASLWISFAYALGHGTQGQRLGIFSFGSGCGAEFMTAKIHHTGNTPWVRDIQEQLKNRQSLSIKEYEALRKNLP